MTARHRKNTTTTQRITTRITTTTIAIILAITGYAALLHHFATEPAWSNMPETTTTSPTPAPTDPDTITITTEDQTDPYLLTTSDPALFDVLAANCAHDYEEGTDDFEWCIGFALTQSCMFEPVDFGSELWVPSDGRCSGEPVVRGL